MNKKLLAFAVSLMLVFGSGLKVKAQAPNQHPFTLTWEGTQRSTYPNYSVSYELINFDGQPSLGNEVYHNDSPDSIPEHGVVTYDFNFPVVTLAGCTAESVQSNTVYTSPSRRTTTVTSGFSCTDSNNSPWSVGTTMTTNQYRSWCRFKYCWGTFPAGQQPATTGTVEQVVAQ